MNVEKIDIDEVVQISQSAGREIMRIYSGSIEVEYKEDESPLTLADKKSNAVIVNALTQLYPDIPIISEENKLLDYQIRKNWSWCWLVDPLDGTKEFIKKNDEFTVNIALVHNGSVQAGVIYVPAMNKTYYAVKGTGAFKVEGINPPEKIQIRPLAQNGTLKVIASRSHKSKEVEDYVTALRKKYSSIDFVAAGSSLKFCLVAEGAADVYPRLAPTMEWDTCAGQIIAQEAGAVVIDSNTNKELSYNKENLLNPYFIVKNPDLQ